MPALKNRFENGDLVKVEFQGQTIQGIVIPNPNPMQLTIKLQSGYNMGFDLRQKIQVKKIGTAKKAQKMAVKTIPKNPNLPTISILHTGGTIASRVDYAVGGVTTGFSPQDLLTLFPELSQKANFQTRLLSSMFSENMRFSQISRIATEIQKELEKKPAGIIVSHGTDTLGYTAAALAFMIENPPVPIILVGAQRSADRGSSDAAQNLSCAVDFILQTDFCGVGICMHETENDSTCVILPPTKTRKLHTSRRDAFVAVNATAIARIAYPSGKTIFLVSNYLKKNHSQKTVFKTKLEEKTALLKTHPNLVPEQIKLFEKMKYRGLVIEGTGLGQIPIEATDALNKKNRENRKAVQSLIKKGCVVCMASQCIFGSVQLHVYSAAVELTNLGVISAHDMLPETAFIKLAWLLGNFPIKEVPRLFETNLRGEINERQPLNAKAPQFQPVE